MIIEYGCRRDIEDKLQRKENFQTFNKNFIIYGTSSLSLNRGTKFYCHPLVFMYLLFS